MSGEAGDERILRGLDRAATATLEKLLGESFFEALVAGGQVVPTKLLDRASPDAKHVLAAGWSAVVEHDPVDFVTWPYEWPFSMLKDAALLQLHLLETAAKNGWLLKDATPFNVQWAGTRPVFIDIPSFIPWEAGDYWRGYRQFCATFLTPLLLTAHLGIPFQPLPPLAPGGNPTGRSGPVFLRIAAIQARRPVAYLVPGQGRARPAPPGACRTADTGACPPTAPDSAVRAAGQPEAAHRETVL